MSGRLHFRGMDRPNDSGGKEKEMKKALVSMVLVAVTICFASPAFPWGSATHAYIDDQLGKKLLWNNQEMYGGMGNDAFNFLFGEPSIMDFLNGKTHREFMEVWNAARLPTGKALAFGFVSHNDEWGADRTAHHRGITFGQNEGYVIAKAQELAVFLKPILLSQGIDLPDMVIEEIAHSFVELGTDLLLKRIEPHIGEKLVAAAMLRSPEFPLLLIKAYGDDLADFAGISRQDAAKLLAATEMGFRRMILAFGQALTKDEVTAIQFLSEQGATLAVASLASKGIILPVGVDLRPLIRLGIAQAMTNCAPDFAGELAATVDFVDEQLRSHGIGY